MLFFVLLLVFCDFLGFGVFGRFGGLIFWDFLIFWVFISSDRWHFGIFGDFLEAVDCSTRSKFLANFYFLKSSWMDINSKLLSFVGVFLILYYF